MWRHSHRPLQIEASASLWLDSNRARVLFLLSDHSAHVDWITCLRQRLLFVMLAGFHSHRGRRRWQWFPLPLHIHTTDTDGMTHWWWHKQLRSGRAVRQWNGNRHENIHNIKHKTSSLAVQPMEGKRKSAFVLLLSISANWLAGQFQRCCGCYFWRCRWWGEREG